MFKFSFRFNLHINIRRYDRQATESDHISDCILFCKSISICHGQKPIVLLIREMQAGFTNIFPFAQYLQSGDAFLLYYTSRNKNLSWRATNLYPHCESKLNLGLCPKTPTLTSVKDHLLSLWIDLSFFLVGRLPSAARYERRYSL